MDDAEDSARHRKQQRIEVEYALEALEADGDQSYVPVARAWWNRWRAWVSERGREPPGTLRPLTENTVGLEDAVCWIPRVVFKVLETFNKGEEKHDEGDKDDKYLPRWLTGRRLTNSRWSFSWEYLAGGSCACCGSSGAPFQCSACKRVRYCNAKCQIVHWSSAHEGSCHSLEDGEDDDINFENGLVNGVGRIQQQLSERRMPKGMVNLGNSCFMNATVQCLVAARPLFKYFLRDEWRLDLRSRHRNVAVAFADLCKSLAFSGAEYVNPAQLKHAVSQLSTGMFAGYQQHDAEEFLLCLLDTLHEDLDVVEKKGLAPQENEDQWASHRRRERSIIDSYMLGSYETSTKCMKCEHESLKTDVFKHLNLALSPNSSERVIVVVVVRQPSAAMKLSLPQRAFQTRYAVLVRKDVTCEVFQREIASAARIPFANLWFVVVEKGILVTEVEPRMMLKRVPPPSLVAGPMLVAYELAANEVKTGAKKVAKDKTENVSPAEESKEVEVGDDRHLICMFARGHQLDKIIPLCISISAAKDTILSVLKRLKEAAWRVLSQFPDIGDVQFFRCDPRGTYDSSYPLISGSTGSNPLFVDVIGNPNFKDGNSKVEFVVCVRATSASALKNDFPDHDSCIRLKHELANELKGDSVLSCLRHFVQPSKLDEENCWKCPKCAFMSAAQQTVRFSRLPEILILVLKRFHVLEGKITTLVRFDTEQMDMGEFVPMLTQGSAIYDLFAVVNHYGSMVGGHYTAFVARDIGDATPASGWYEVDDSKRHEIPKEQAVCAAAYILFYRKRKPSGS